MDIKDSNSILIHPPYFGSIAFYAALVKPKNIIFENEDNYQKQSYRNRMYIYGANGKLLLNIPIKHSKEGKHQKYKDVKIENDFPWQIQHWKSLESAYRTSPYFEYYEDEFRPLFTEKKTFLLDYNYQCMEVVNACLSLDVSYQKTVTFERILTDEKDLRNLINAKASNNVTLTPYIQVFNEKFGFIPNLSILDLLFNEGTNALGYLEAVVTQ